MIGKADIGDQDLARKAKSLATELDSATSPEAQKRAAEHFLVELNELRDDPKSAQKLVAYTAQYERQSPEKGTKPGENPAKPGLNVVAVKLEDGKPKVYLQREVSDNSDAVAIKAGETPDRKAKVALSTQEAVHDAASPNPKNTFAWNKAITMWDSTTAENITTLAQLTKDNKAPEIVPTAETKEPPKEPLIRPARQNEAAV